MDLQLCFDSSWIKVNMAPALKYLGFILITIKTQNIWTLNYHRNYPKIWQCSFAISLKDADRINCIDPDQTAPSGAVWSVSALFAQIYLSQNFELLWYFQETYPESLLCTAWYWQHHLGYGTKWWSLKHNLGVSESIHGFKFWILSFLRAYLFSMGPVTIISLFSGEIKY